jgi:hypothetical protein
VTGGKVGKWAYLHEVRSKLGGTKEQQDAALQQLMRSGDAVLSPESSVDRHRPEFQAAAWRGNHLIALQPPE